MVDETASRGAQRSAHWAVFAGLAGAIWVVDQLTKAWLVGHLAPSQVVDVVGDVVRLVFSQNSGALFGLFHDQALLFGLVSIGVVGLIVAYHGRSPRSLSLSIALGFLLGGALGNMTDRLRLGYVVDFVDLGFGNLRWYTFNVADAAISIAIVVLIVLGLFGHRLGRLGGMPSGSVDPSPRSTGEPTRGAL